MNEAMGFGSTAKNAAAVLSACPALTKLKVSIPNSGIDHRKMMDQEMFGDTFCEALATHCPSMEILEIGDMRGLEPRDTQPIMTFTDRALDALRSLPYLLAIRTKATNFTGHGLFSLVEHSQYGTTSGRVIDLCVGDTTGPTMFAFYDVLESFLTCLTLPSEKLTFLDRRVALRVRNGNNFKMPREWSMSYFARIQALVDAFQHRRRGAGLVISTKWADRQRTCVDCLNSFQLRTKAFREDAVNEDSDAKVFVDSARVRDPIRFISRQDGKGEFY